MAESLPLYQRVGVLRPLQHRDFRLLWIGQTVSMIGDGIYVFAVAWFVYKDLHASPAYRLRRAAGESSPANPDRTRRRSAPARPTS